MHWILILIIESNFPSAGITFQEFESKDSCIEAGNFIMVNYNKDDDGKPTLENASFKCVAK